MGERKGAGFFILSPVISETKRVGKNELPEVSRAPSKVGEISYLPELLALGSPVYSRTKATRIQTVRKGDAGTGGKLPLTKSSTLTYAGRLHTGT